jgi:hypothetical protein
MNWAQISHHLDYLMEQIQNNHQEDEIMSIIHLHAGYLIGNRNYLEEIQQRRITKYGLLCKLKDDLIYQAQGHAAVHPAIHPPVPAPGHPGPCQVSLQVIQDFTQSLCKVVYK